MARASNLRCGSRSSLYTVRALPAFYLFVAFCCLLLTKSGSAQADSSAHSNSANAADSANNDKPLKNEDKIHYTERAIKNIFEKDKKELVQEKNTVRQIEIFEEVKSATQRAYIFLKHGIDTSGFNTNISKIRVWENIAGNGLFTNIGAPRTYRNLSTSYNLLTVLLAMAEKQQAELNSYQKRLVALRFEIDSLTIDTALVSFPPDSAGVIKYLRRLLLTATEIHPVDSAIKKTIANVDELQSQVNIEVYKITSAMSEIEGYQRDNYNKLFGHELANLWDSMGNAKAFKEAIHYSYPKDRLTLFFYAENNIIRLLLIAILMIASARYLSSLKKIMAQQGKLLPDYAGQLVLKYPSLSAIVLVLNLFQFIFLSPPFIFSACIWMLSCICLTIIFKDNAAKYWLRNWLIMMAVFVLVCCNNLVLQATSIERWLMLLLALPGIFFGVRVAIYGRSDQLREPAIIYAVYLLAIMEFLSIIFNLYGRYNLSKSLLTAGYLNVVIAELFLWTVRFINQGLTMASSIYNGPEKKLFFINYRAVGTKAPAFLYVLLIIGWMILFGRNFYAFTIISQPVKDFLVDERHVGSYTFTIFNAVAFIGIMIISVVISKIVSFFAGDKHHISGDNNKNQKSGIGSWLLLIRISIISVGLFLAFAAAGIPMDRVAIVIGALGVGIGFGLQTIVNNLVSGLILAFEKQLNVGDIIEIGGQSGTVKSVGFRSSVIVTGDGADVIMPNGDLLNAHLINWSLSGGKKCMNIVVAVPNATNLETTKKILKDIIQADDRILKFPLAEVVFQDFAASNINVKISFWVRYFSEGVNVKSDTIEKIKTVFQQHGIMIPAATPVTPVPAAPLPPLSDNAQKK